MTSNDLGLGSLLGTHRAAGGFTGFQNTAAGRTLFLTLAGVAVGFIPGLIVALIADLVIALLIGPVIGGVLAFLWARRQTQEAAVTEARIHELGVVFVDGRGEHEVRWTDIVAIEGRRIQTVAGTPLGDVKGAINSSYALRTRDGKGFWIDDRVQDADGLAASLARASGKPIARMG